jgi:hypothetical protein
MRQASGPPGTRDMQYGPGNSLEKGSPNGGYLPLGKAVLARLEVPWP